MGFLGNSVATADDLQTIIPPQFYQQTDDGQVVLATTDGQKVILGESQYLILEDGLLIITDELAQNTLNSLSVLGSFRSSDFTFPDAVSSSSGDIIETSSQQPVWSGDRPTFQSLGVETYELAQNNSKPEGSESSSNGTGIGNAGLGAGFGFGLMGLFFGSEKTEETPAATTSQETTPAPVTPYSGPARGFVINGIDASDTVVVPCPLLVTSTTMDTMTSSLGQCMQTLMAEVQVSPMSCLARHQELTQHLSNCRL